MMPYVPVTCAFELHDSADQTVVGYPVQVMHEFMSLCCMLVQILVMWI